MLYPLMWPCPCSCVCPGQMRDPKNLGLMARQAGPLTAAQVNIPGLAFLLILALLGSSLRRRPRFHFRQADVDIDAMVHDFDRQTGVLSQAEAMGIPFVVAHDSLREVMSFAVSRIDLSRPIHDIRSLADRLTDEFLVEHRDLLGMLPTMGHSMEEVREAVRPVMMFVLERFPH